MKVETVKSVQKRTTGSSVLSRKTGQRHKELIFRALGYNGRRMEALFLVLIEGFYKAPCEGQGKRNGIAAEPGRLCPLQLLQNTRHLSPTAERKLDATAVVPDDLP